MTAKYRWMITKDHVFNPECDWHSRIGIEGPHNPYEGFENRSTFKMYDDDGELYYEGVIFGKYDGDEPLYDFGMPNSGCTKIRLNGIWV